MKIIREIVERDGSVGYAVNSPLWARLVLTAWAIGAIIVSSGCTVMLGPPTPYAYDGWVAPAYPHVTPWEYVRLNGCTPRPVVYDDPEVYEAERVAREAEAEVRRERRLNRAEERLRRAEADLERERKKG